MSTKRIEYVPAVETPSDLPLASAYQSGVAFYVQSLLALVSTNGTVWTVITGTSAGTVVA